VENFFSNTNVKISAVGNDDQKEIFLHHKEKRRYLPFLHAQQVLQMYHFELNVCEEKIQSFMLFNQKYMMRKFIQILIYIYVVFHSNVNWMRFACFQPVIHFHHFHKHRWKQINFVVEKVLFFLPQLPCHTSWQGSHIFSTFLPRNDKT
jgi:hypothetical protein